MKNIYIFTISFLLLIIHIKSHAIVPCGNNPSSELFPGNVGNYITLNVVTEYNLLGKEPKFNYTHSSDLISNSLISCFGTNLYKRKDASFDAFENSNLIDRRVGNGGLIYVKVENTSNDFVNKHAWIYYMFKDPADNINLGIWVAYPSAIVPLSSSDVPSQGIRFRNFRIYFDKAPIQPIVNLPIKLGTLTSEVWDTNNSSEVKKAVAQVIINVVPETLKTCNVNNENVQLPTILTTDLTNTNRTTGRKDFSVTVDCSSNLSGTALSYSLDDHFQIGNSTNIISNSNTQSNVAVQMYDALTNDALSMRTELSLGTVNSTTSRIIKAFYAQYYKVNDEPTVAGAVNAQVTLNVFYK